MRDSVKIALGIVLGFACSAAFCCGAFTLFGSALPTVEEITRQGTPEPHPVPAVRTVTAVPAVTPWEGLGHYVIHDGLKLGVMEYRVTDSRITSWGEQEKPAKGAKFISFRIYVENIGETAITFPDLFDTEIVYKGEDIAAHAECDAEWINYGDCIWERVYPGTSCEGWKCYEIPEGIQPSEITLRLNISTDAWEHEWHSWRLE